jgi:hypothetical protein
VSSFELRHLQAIEEAIGTGALSVTFQGRTVVYRTMKDLIMARDVIKAGLRDAGLLPKKHKFSYLARGRR